LINNNFILTVDEQKLFPNNKMEFFLEPNTFRLIRNTYKLLNQIKEGIENKDCSSILSFLLNQMKNDQKSFTYLINQLAYAIQNGKPSDITIILYGKFGKGVAILFDLILSLLFKPSQMLEGRLQFDQWVDSQTGAKRNKHSLMVNEMKMPDSKSDSGYTPSQNTAQPGTQPQNQPRKEPEYRQPPVQNNIPIIDIDADEIPF